MAKEKEVKLSFRGVVRLQRKTRDERHSASWSTKDSIYDEVGGCPVCPYVEECVVLTDCAGYTMNDEHGVCPEELVKRHQEKVG